MKNLFRTKIISNEKQNKDKIQKAKNIILNLQKDIEYFTSQGSGPFVAAIYDCEENKIVKTANSVTNENCSNCHAEINAIKLAQKKYNTYDLSKYNLSIFITAEPCMMCIGAIMWSGIKNVYYGVPSKIVEKITNFDEGFKPNWHNEFKKRGIIVYGNIETEIGIQQLKKYVNEGKNIYKPNR